MQPNSTNTLFPVFLKLEHFRVLIVGGGKVGLEKLNAVLTNSPQTSVKLVAIKVCDDIKVLSARHDHVQVYERAYTPEDLADTDLALVAVNDRDLSLAIRKKAASLAILTNVADTPEQCDFYLGSIVNKGHVKIAISTNGKSPTIAKRLRETLEENFPAEINNAIEDLSAFRKYLSKDFTEKVKQLNAITAVLSKKGIEKKPLVSRQRIWIYCITAPLLILSGYLYCVFLPPDVLGGYIAEFSQSIDASVLLYMLAGFTAQLIDGALGMGYGITATSFLLSFGIAPAMSSASVHASEVFTSGASGLMHLRFGNVNQKLFRSLLVPGVLGAILGAYILSSFSQYASIIKPLVSAYTLLLGIVIVLKAIKKDKVRRKIKRIFPLALLGGFLDSIGGGGWGPIVASTLIAKGRSPQFTIGSVNLAEFFIALSSSLTFITLIGLTHWTIIAGLVIGGVVATPFAAMLTNKIPTRYFLLIVGLASIILSLKRLLF